MPYLVITLLDLSKYQKFEKQKQTIKRIAIFLVLFLTNKQSGQFFIKYFSDLLLTPYVGNSVDTFNALTVLEFKEKQLKT